MDKHLKVVMVVLDYIQQFQEQTLPILVAEVVEVVVVRAHQVALAA